MPAVRPPERPVEGYVAVRDEWIAAVAALVDQAAQWSKERDWDIRHQTKPMYESELGSYEIPRLLIHNGVGRVLLDPVGRYIVGLEGGAVDLLSVPDYDGWLLAREYGAWSFYDGYDRYRGDDAASRPWSAETFADAVSRLARP